MKLLDAEPPALRRPLALIDGRAYAAIWPHLRVTRSDEVTKAGELVRLDPPRVTIERRLLVVRDDGRTFGENADALWEDLGLEVRLPESPPPDKLWSARGVTAYRRGYRPEPADVFLRLSAVVDRFIDFNRSLADQETMSDMVACYVLAGWFLDALNVIGNLWPNGDRGRGKMQLLNVVRELGGDRVWRTRYVNTFTPRLFSATRLPDPILASRTIVVPLIRTPDRHRANADPLDYSLWPCDRRELIDDLRALALAYQAERSDLETADLTRLVIQALVHCAAELARPRCDVGDRNDGDDVKRDTPGVNSYYITNHKSCQDGSAGAGVGSRHRHPDSAPGGTRAAQDALAIGEDQERQGLGRQPGRTAPLDPRLRG